MWYLTLSGPDRETVTYELGNDPDDAAALVPAAKAHAGFPPGVQLESQDHARLWRVDPIPGRLVPVAELDPLLGAAYAALELSAAQDGAKAAAMSALRQLDGPAMRELLLDLADQLKETE
jgi:hypothetical protein